MNIVSEEETCESVFHINLAEAAMGTSYKDLQSVRALLCILDTILTYH